METDSVNHYYKLYKHGQITLGCHVIDRQWGVVYYTAQATP